MLAIVRMMNWLVDHFPLVLGSVFLVVLFVLGGGYWLALRRREP